MLVQERNWLGTAIDVLTSGMIDPIVQLPRRAEIVLGDGQANGIEDLQIRIAVRLPRKHDQEVLEVRHRLVLIGRRLRELAAADLAENPDGPAAERNEKERIDLLLLPLGQHDRAYGLHAVLRAGNAPTARASRKSTTDVSSIPR